jgi:hypothetical protein
VSYLCDSCLRLDLKVESFVVQPGDNEHERTNRFRYLGRLSQIQQRLHCPCCRLILRIADRPPDQRTPSHVSAADDPVIYGRWVVDGQEEQEQGKFLPKTRRILIYSQPQVFKDGYLVLHADDAPTRAYFGKQLAAQDLLDADVLRGWLKDCQSMHGQACEGSLVPPELLGSRIEKFRAIDVNSMCIAEPPDDARYIALSYLWGKGFSQLFTTSHNLTKLSKPGALDREKLPRTIKDAIVLTRLLGERWLWTDSLALIHDEGFQYHDDWVYARATLTVVAGSGKDANAGLPGVRKESRLILQEIEEIKPGLRLMVSHLAEDYISTSQWDSRAWTFAERMLSRRCLLFVNGRIYYQCRRATFCEDIEPPSTNGWSLNSIDNPTKIFREKPFWQYTSAVELYTQRELTNLGDILNAFEAIGHVLEKRLHSKLCFGLMEDHLDNSLLWESTQRLTHRPNFSTFSWAGWVGEIQWKYSDLEYAESWIEWHDTTAHDEALVAIPKQHSRRIPPPVPRSIKHRAAGRSWVLEDTMPRLHFQTLVATFTLMKPECISKEFMSPMRKRMTGPSALSTKRPAPTDPGLIRAGIADRNGEWCGTIDLNMVYRDMVNIPFEFLIMSRLSAFTETELDAWEGIVPDAVEEEMTLRNYGVYNVLLVTSRDGIRYREGIGRIMASAVTRCLAPGPLWEDVILG